MELTLSPILRYALYLSFIFMFLGIALTLLRLAMGPSMTDRIVAIDLFTVFVMGILLLYGVATGFRYVLNAVTVMALISFIGTVSFARYLEKGVNK